MGKYNGLFVNTIEWDKKRIEKIDAELENLPKWRFIRRQWLLRRRGKLAEYLLKMQAIKADMKDENYTTTDDFFQKAVRKRHEYR